MEEIVRMIFLRWNQENEPKITEEDCFFLFYAYFLNKTVPVMARAIIKTSTRFGVGSL